MVRPRARDPAPGLQRNCTIPDSCRRISSDNPIHTSTPPSQIPHSFRLGRHQLLDANLRQVQQAVQLPALEGLPFAGGLHFNSAASVRRWNPSRDGRVVGLRGRNVRSVAGGSFASVRTSAVPASGEWAGNRAGRSSAIWGPMYQSALAVASSPAALALLTETGTETSLPKGRFLSISMRASQGGGRDGGVEGRVRASPFQHVPFVHRH